MPILGTKGDLILHSTNDSEEGISTQLIAKREARALIGIKLESDFFIKETFLERGAAF